MKNSDLTFEAFRQFVPYLCGALRWVHKDLTELERQGQIEGLCVFHRENDWKIYGYPCRKDESSSRGICVG